MKQAAPPLRIARIASLFWNNKNMKQDRRLIQNKEVIGLAFIFWLYHTMIDNFVTMIIMLLYIFR